MKQLLPNNPAVELGHLPMSNYNLQAGLPNK
jgi:hypothetical protein